MNKPFVAILIVGLLVSTSLLGFLVGQASIDTTDYYLDTPLPLAAFYVGKYSNGSYFAVNGSNWDNFMVSTNATDVLQVCIDAVIGGGVDGRIIVGVGDYDLQDDYLLFWDYDGAGSVFLEGETKPSDRGVVFEGSGAYMITSNVTDWIQGGDGGFHRIDNIKFEHNTKNSASVTLRFHKVMVETHNVWVTNTNATSQGTGMYCGNMGGNTGMCFTWENPVVTGYATAFFLGVDHLTVINPEGYSISQYGLNWNNSAWTTIINLQFAGFATPTTCIPLYFNHMAQGAQVFGCSIEGATITFNEPMIVVVNGWKVVQVHGFFSQATMGAGIPFWNRTDTGGTPEYYVYLDAHSGEFLSTYSGLATVADNEVIAHGLLNAPYYILLTIEDDIIKDDVAIQVCAEYKNATHFRVGVYWANGTAYATDDIEIYWFASVNRR